MACAPVSISLRTASADTGLTFALGHYIFELDGYLVSVTVKQSRPKCGVFRLALLSRFVFFAFYHLQYLKNCAGVGIIVKRQQRVVSQDCPKLRY
jgi:hypothetical protein